MFIKTVSTTSGINPIKFDETGGVFYWILNTGSSTIYASTKSAFTAGDDGVVSLGPKESRRLETNNDTIYILGEGQVEIHNQRDGICSFKQAPTSSGGGETIDAYTKTESDAKYAAKTDVPDAYTKTESDDKYAQKTDVVPYKMGMDFGTCTTPAETVVKSVTTMHKVAPALGAVFAVKFNNAVPAQARLNINGLTGYIQYRGGSIPNGVINAGDIATFIYYSGSGFNAFEILSVENGGNAKTVNGFTVGCNVPADAVFTPPDLSGYASKALYGDTTINVGRKVDSVVGEKSTAEGLNTIASGAFSHAEGSNATASGNTSHAEGAGATASGSDSHAEGYNTTASDFASHAEGSGTVASGYYSHAEGQCTIANNEAEHASGKFNVSNEDTLFSVGDGTDADNRHNAFEITKTGGKLHDRDIGISFTQAESGAIRIGIPDSVDVAQWLMENAKSGSLYYILIRGSRTGLPDVSADWMWFSYDGNRYFARAWTGDTHTSDFVLDAVNSVGGWKEISYTPIKSTTFSGTTNANGDILWLSASENKIPLFANVESKYAIPVNANGNYWFYMMYATAANHAQPAVNVAVSGTVYYIEI